MTSLISLLYRSTTATTAKTVLLFSGYDEKGLAQDKGAANISPDLGLLPDNKQSTYVAMFRQIAGRYLET